MIISASRRTDIPAFYMDWLLKRLEEGFVLVRHPVQRHQVSRIDLSLEGIDCIVFWSKYPRPLLAHLAELQPYLYYVQFTLNGYDLDLEPKVPPLIERVNTFQQLSAAIGQERVIWRYDPIVITPKYTLSYHMEIFEALAEQLQGYTQKCIFSFFDRYEKLSSAIEACHIHLPADEQKYLLAEQFSKIAKKHHVHLESCAEQMDLESLHIAHSHCIDERLITSLSSIPLRGKKDPYQRVACGCVASIDIGAYHTCPHGCRYCYANGPVQAAQWPDRHSPILGSFLQPEDIVKKKKMESLQERQLRLF